MSYSFKKQLKSFTFAWKGILTCAGHEQNITFHLIAAIIVLAAGFCFGISRMAKNSRRSKRYSCWCRFNNSHRSSYCGNDSISSLRDCPILIH